MTLQHLVKVLAFSLISVALFAYAWELAVFSCCAILGTRVGVGVLSAISEQAFRIGFKTVTSTIGTYLIYTGVSGFISP